MMDQVHWEAGSFLTFHQEGRPAANRNRQGRIVRKNI